LREHVSDSANGALWATLRESHPQPSYRCQIVINCGGAGMENFLLDLLSDDFEQLPDLPQERVVQLARWALGQLPLRRIHMEPPAIGVAAAVGFVSVAMLATGRLRRTDHHRRRALRP
jgi:hypothetical protein